MCRLVCRRDRRLRFLLVCFLKFRARRPPPARSGSRAGRASQGGTLHPRPDRARSLTLSSRAEHHKWKDVSIFLPGSFIHYRLRRRAHRSSAVQTASGPRLPLPQFYGCGTREGTSRGWPRAGRGAHARRARTTNWRRTRRRSSRGACERAVSSRGFRHERARVLYRSELQGHRAARRRTCALVRRWLFRKGKLHYPLGEASTSGRGPE